MKLLGILDALTSKADHLEFQMRHDPTPAQQAEQEAAEVANYVEHMKGYAMREVAYDSNHMAHWREYVIDQHGRKHIVDEGSFYAGFPVGIAAEKNEIVPVVQGEAMSEDELNAYYARYLGSG